MSIHFHEIFFDEKTLPWYLNGNLNTDPGVQKFLQTHPGYQEAYSTIHNLLITKHYHLINSYPGLAGNNLFEKIVSLENTDIKSLEIAKKYAGSDARLIDKFNYNDLRADYVHDSIFDFKVESVIKDSKKVPKIYFKETHPFSLVGLHALSQYFFQTGIHFNNEEAFSLSRAHEIAGFIFQAEFCSSCLQHEGEGEIEFCPIPHFKECKDDVHKIIKLGDNYFTEEYAQTDWGTLILENFKLKEKQDIKGSFGLNTEIIEIHRTRGGDGRYSLVQPPEPLYEPNKYYQAKYFLTEEGRDPKNAALRERYLAMQEYHSKLRYLVDAAAYNVECNKKFGLFPGFFIDQVLIRSEIMNAPVVLLNLPNAITSDEVLIPLCRCGLIKEGDTEISHSFLLGYLEDYYENMRIRAQKIYDSMELKKDNPVDPEVRTQIFPDAVYLRVAYLERIAEIESIAEMDKDLSKLDKACRNLARIFYPFEERLDFFVERFKITTKEVSSDQPFFYNGTLGYIDSSEVIGYRRSQFQEKFLSKECSVLMAQNKDEMSLFSVVPEESRAMKKLLRYGLDIIYSGHWDSIYRGDIVEDLTNTTGISFDGDCPENKKFLSQRRYEKPVYNYGHLYYRYLLSYFFPPIEVDRYVEIDMCFQLNDLVFDKTKRTINPLLLKQRSVPIEVLLVNFAQEVMKFNYEMTYALESVLKNTDTAERNFFFFLDIIKDNIIDTIEKIKTCLTFNHSPQDFVIAFFITTLLMKFVLVLVAVHINLGWTNLLRDYALKNSTAKEYRWMRQSFYLLIFAEIDYLIKKGFYSP